MTNPISAEQDRLRARLAEVDRETRSLAEERGHIVYTLEVLARLGVGATEDKPVGRPESSSRTAAGIVSQRELADIAAVARSAVANMPNQRELARMTDAARTAMASAVSPREFERLAAAGRIAAETTLSRVGSTRAPRQVGAATHHYVLEALKHFDSPVSVDEIVAKMREIGWESDAQNPIESARAALSRAKSDGDVERPSHGKYILARQQSNDLLSHTSEELTVGLHSEIPPHEEDTSSAHPPVDKPDT